MDDQLKTYPVLSRLRHSGTIYGPDGDNNNVDLTEAEAAPLLRLKTIGEPQNAGEADPDLKSHLVDLIAEGHDVASLKMGDLLKLLGKHGRGVKRDDVDAALASITDPDNA